MNNLQIDVENPCVIMSQDKSREFLHSGNDKDKFKVISPCVHIEVKKCRSRSSIDTFIAQFFFKATLLQQVNDLLQSIYEQLRSANALVDELEATIKPIEKELNELQVKIKNMEHIEEISQQVQQLKKKLAWSWVYYVDKQLEDQSMKISKLKDRIPACQDKIEQKLVSEIYIPEYFCPHSVFSHLNNTASSHSFG